MLQLAAVLGALPMAIVLLFALPFPSQTEPEEKEDKAPPPTVPSPSQTDSEDVRSTPLEDATLTPPPIVAHVVSGFQGGAVSGSATAVTREEARLNFYFRGGDEQHTFEAGEPEVR